MRIPLIKRFENEAKKRKEKKRKEKKRKEKKRKVRRIFSTTETWNKISIRMHESLGYRRCGYIDNMWEEGERDIVFSKKIK